eukprot:TRINITY_DN9727_c0_g1_i1.p1 TRINITY_DN9727_c0_g1~~TRINITY_DN9727_c0_g1_i1.p1  ORF type:complete len:290 (-),score=54.98 TRINITY_DN9727_c0_g1_i1:18-887(-)
MLGVRTGLIQVKHRGQGYSSLTKQSYLHKRRYHRGHIMLKEYPHKNDPFVKPRILASIGTSMKEIVQSEKKVFPVRKGISVRLGRAITSYRSVVETTVNVMRGIPDDLLLVKCDQYLSVFNAKKVVPLDDDFMKVIDAAHKMLPVMYAERDVLEKTFLLDVVKHHYEFCEKVTEVIKKRGMKNDWKIEYLEFLAGFSEWSGTETPTLVQEMMWRSHMIQHEAYKRDCIKVFGRIVNHNYLYKPDTLVIPKPNTKFSISDLDVLFDLLEIIFRAIVKIALAIAELFSLGS